MTSITRPAWRWSDHWSPRPPPGWNGQHEVSVRGYSTVFETAGVTLSCSCGRKARASEDSDDGGPVSLAVLNELAAAHQAENPA